MAPSANVTRWAPLADQAGARYHIPPAVLLADIQVESGGDINASSSAGAFGLTQFLPGTATGYGVRRGDPASQIMGQAHYLADLGYASNPTKALASYNAGPGNYQLGLGYARTVLNDAPQYTTVTHNGGSGTLPPGAPPPTGGGGGGAPGGGSFFDLLVKAVVYGAAVVGGGALVLYGTRAVLQPSKATK